eukprot:CAMPEP_0184651732 /NCGR_PEP_ID=MMETSP0308-20130426/9388_1 /TAXON_ID=38269 /ORGANISM="Gloeochaete witrockiana, Strain SAG 46.84" /LENGTH=1111 /DNA_ID=CAMNT_0027086165 /DNA_START=38 /DNA_END=3373 /DNA_ORIENTATION=-
MTESDEEYNEQDDENNVEADEEQDEENDRPARSARDIRHSNEPTSWAEVELDEEAWEVRSETEPVNLLDEEQSKVFDDTQDPLGLGLIQDLLSTADDEDQEEDFSVSLKGAARNVVSSSNFDAAMYIRTVHRHTSYADLRDGLRNLQDFVNDQTKQLKALVKENFPRFVSCRQSIDITYNRLRENEDVASPGSTAALDLALTEVQRAAEGLFGPIVQRKRDTDQIRSVLALMRKFHFIFSLPSSIHANFLRKEYDKVVHDYNKAKSLLANTRVPLLRKVMDEVTQHLTKIRTALFAQLHAPNAHFDDYHRTISYLFELDAKEDPAHFFLTKQRDRICNLLHDALTDLLAHNAASPGQAQEQEQEREQQGSRDIKLNLVGGKIDECVARMTATMLNNVSEFWHMAHTLREGVSQGQGQGGPQPPSERGFRSKLPKAQCDEVASGLLSDIVSAYASGVVAAVNGGRMRSASAAGTGAASADHPESASSSSLPLMNTESFLKTKRSARRRSHSDDTVSVSAASDNSSTGKASATTAAVLAGTSEWIVSRGSVLQGQGCYRMLLQLSPSPPSSATEAARRLDDRLTRRFVISVWDDTKQAISCLSGEDSLWGGIGTAAQAAADGGPNANALAQRFSTPLPSSLPLPLPFAMPLPELFRTLITDAIDECRALVSSERAGSLYDRMERAFFESIRSFATSLNDRATAAAATLPVSSTPASASASASASRSNPSENSSAPLPRSHLSSSSAAAPSASASPSPRTGAPPSPHHRRMPSDLEPSHLPYPLEPHSFARAPAPSVSCDETLLMCVAFAETVKTQIVPLLWSLFSEAFNPPASASSSTHYDGCVEAFEQVQSGVLGRYVQLKAATLHTIVRRALAPVPSLSPAASPSPSPSSAIHHSLLPSDVRDYVLEMVVELVHIHAQVFTCAPASVQHVLPRLVADTTLVLASCIPLCLPCNAAGPATPAPAPAPGIVVPSSDLLLCVPSPSDSTFPPAPALTAAALATAFQLGVEIEFWERVASGSSCQGLADAPFDNAFKMLEPIYYSPHAHALLVQGGSSTGTGPGTPNNRSRRRPQSRDFDATADRVRRPSECSPRIKELLKEIVHRNRVLLECLA